jgi:hypothetical protein
VRRLLRPIMLAAAAGIMIPAAAGATGSAARAAVGPVTPRFGLRLVDVPVSEAHNPRALRYIIDFLPPGTVIHRRILILNEERRTAHFTVYPDAARITDGSFIGDVGQTRSELTSWVTLQHRAVTLRPRASVMDMVTIRVPRHPTRGEHYGVIWVQQVAHLHAASGVAIREVARVGVRIYLAVGPGGAPPTKFAITSIAGHRTSRGQPVITARVRDTGGRAVDLSGTARLSAGPGGASAGPYPIYRVITLAPGQSGTVTFLPGSGLPSGPWRAAITLTSGITRESASAAIQFAAGATTTAWSRPVITIPLIGLGIALLVLLAVRVRGSLRARRAGLTRPAGVR